MNGRTGKMLYAKIMHEDSGKFYGYIQPLDLINDAIDVELDGATVGDRFIVEIVEMSEDDYSNLKEFEGW
jgi:hypothetical protein